MLQVTKPFDSENASEHIRYLHHLREYDSGQLPDGLIAQLVDYCTSITEVIGPNPVQA